MKVIDVPEKDQYSLLTLRTQCDQTLTDYYNTLDRFRRRQAQTIERLAGPGHNKKLSDDFRHIVIEP